MVIKNEQARLQELRSQRAYGAREVHKCSICKGEDDTVTRYPTHNAYSRQHRPWGDMRPPGKKFYHYDCWRLATAVTLLPTVTKALRGFADIEALQKELVEIDQKMERTVKPAEVRELKVRQITAQRELIGLESWSEEEQQLYHAAADLLDKSSKLLALRGAEKVRKVPK